MLKQLQVPKPLKGVSIPRRVRILESNADVHRRSIFLSGSIWKFQSFFNPDRKRSQKFQCLRRLITPSKLYYMPEYIYIYIFCFGGNRRLSQIVANFAVKRYHIFRIIYRSLKDIASCADEQSLFFFKYSFLLWL
jgi:hypothetical protein